MRPMSEGKTDSRGNLKTLNSAVSIVKECIPKRTIYGRPPKLARQVIFSIPSFLTSRFMSPVGKKFPSAHRVYRPGEADCSGLVKYALDHSRGRVAPSENENH